MAVIYELLPVLCGGKKKKQTESIMCDLLPSNKSSTWVNGSRVHTPLTHKHDLLSSYMKVHAGDVSDCKSPCAYLLDTLWYFSLSLSSIHAPTWAKAREHLSPARVLTGSKQRFLYQPMSIRATGTPFIPIISDYHHWVLFLLPIFICTIAGQQIPIRHHG